MNLLKTSALNGIAVVIKMLTLLGINKVLAIYVGPAGYAAIGQFQNAVQMITTFASGAINTGVTKYTAEYQEQPQEQYKVWRTAFAVSLLGALLAAVLIVVFNQYLAVWILKDEALGDVFIWFAATLVFFTLNALLLAVLNGKKEIVRYVVANIAGSLFALLVTVLMTMSLGLYGALVALAVYQSLSFFVTVVLCLRSSWFRWQHFIGRVERSAFVKLSNYTLMALTSAICVPLSHMYVRQYLGDNFSWVEAGYWEAMWRMSAAYLLLVTTTLSVYLLPRLSALQEKGEIRKELLSVFKLMLPVTAAGCALIYLFRDLVIALLFSKEFMPVGDLFLWQLVGDFLKIAGWAMAYLMLSKPMVKTYVATEVLFSLSFYLLTVVLTKKFGFSGVALAHAVNYLVYLVVMYVVIFKIYLRTDRES
ncbi:O-antigen translocase [Pseudomonas wadenswilerensis]|uniref:O-antigen translocase n=1 Tax=Pseudomonas wadenswilerensis TaxID=1785161 RepID=UPI003208AAA8